MYSGQHLMNYRDNEKETRLFAQESAQNNFFFFEEKPRITRATGNKCLYVSKLDIFIGLVYTDL